MTDIKKSSSKKSSSKSDKIIKTKNNLFDNINLSDFNLSFTLNNFALSQSFTSSTLPNNIYSVNECTDS